MGKQGIVSLCEYYNLYACKKHFIVQALVTVTLKSLVPFNISSPLFPVLEAALVDLHAVVVEESELVGSHLGPASGQAVDQDRVVGVRLGEAVLGLELIGGHLERVPDLAH